ncbi:MAG: hypothetical protein WDN04_17935 [Rhodospirillales bacterium]
MLRQAHARGDLRLPHPAAPERGSGFVVLAMGKLGARELNFSSDVDLILLHDPAVHPEFADSLGHVFTRMARDLVGLMEARDAGGYVFRVDLRLRPDPASTPPSVALPAALAYYESMGQDVGAGGADQGAPGRRRFFPRPALPGGSASVHLAAPSGFRRHCRHPRHEAPAWTRTRAPSSAPAARPRRACWRTI